MYYGELCVKANVKEEGSTLVFYTRKRKNRVLPEGEEVCVGSSITIDFSDKETIKNTLLDVYVAATQGTCYKTVENGEVLWKCKANKHTSIMTGRVILEIVSFKNRAEFHASLFKDDSMDTEDLGYFNFSDTGKASLVQKTLAALEMVGVTREEAMEYKNSVTEDSY